MSDSERAILLDRSDRQVWVLTLNRPERLNAISYAMLERLFGIFDELRLDHDCRAVILTGAGRGFCSGIDIKALEQAPGLNLEGLGQVPGFVHTLENWWNQLAPRIRALRQPVISAVNGPAAGGGYVMALASDIRIASERASFKSAFIKIGLSGAELGFGYLLPRLIGMSRAAELMLTGRQIDAAEAERIGLVHQVVPHAELLDAARAKAQEIIENTPFGTWMTKETMWADLEAPSLQHSIEVEMRTQVLTLLTEDQREQLSAFIEKRAGKYRFA